MRCCEYVTWFVKGKLIYTTENPCSKTNNNNDSKAVFTLAEFSVITPVTATRIDI
jgi:hypothetical protein